ncbi:MAG TPA: YhgE/Pip domain-containing protein, partial [Bacillota bacterium]|nr:YhgE/Pip domain-containing protein [Bacillota bacterium]
KFFQMISPFLPFTYAVGLMREAVGGIVWSNVAINIGVLALIGTIALVLGALLKRIINELAEKFLGESEDSGIFH